MLLDLEETPGAREDEGAGDGRGVEEEGLDRVLVAGAKAEHLGHDICVCVEGGGGSPRALGDREVRGAVCAGSHRQVEMTFEGATRTVPKKCVGCTED